MTTWNGKKRAERKTKDRQVFIEAVWRQAPQAELFDLADAAGIADAEAQRILDSVVDARQAMDAAEDAEKAEAEYASARASFDEVVAELQPKIEELEAQIDEASAAVDQAAIHRRHATDALATVKRAIERDEVPEPYWPQWYKDLLETRAERAEAEKKLSAWRAEKDKLANLRARRDALKACIESPPAGAQNKRTDPTGNIVSVKTLKTRVGKIEKQMNEQAEKARTAARGAGVDD
jgi:hypothetical protein